MAKKKKHQQKKSATNFTVSRTHQERCYIVAKKVLQHFDLEPDLIDVFTKRQKQHLFMLCFDPPTVKPKKERTVPRQYLRNIQTDMIQFMKSTFFGNPENQLTYMELVVYGLSFLVNLSNMIERDTIIHGSPQEEAAKKISEKYDKTRFCNESFIEILNDVWFNTRCYSRIYFRYYGFDFTLEHFEKTGGTSMRPTILITAQECEIKKFTYKGIERKAYRILNTADGWHEPSQATVCRNLIFPNAKDDELLNIYAQSHVLHRLKERLNAFDPAISNLLIQYAFTGGLKVVKFEKQTLFSCLIEDALPVGYFTFFVFGDDIVINTFIPLASPNTPEGKILHELLPLDKDAVVYLGMDKLSFFLEIDFEQIPALKQALIDSNIWQSKLVLDRINERENLTEAGTSINMKKTMFVKEYFYKLEEHNKQYLNGPKGHN